MQINATTMTHEEQSARQHAKLAKHAKHAKQAKHVKHAK
jgi:hypothetical protein